MAVVEGSPPDIAPPVYVFWLTVNVWDVTVLEGDGTRPLCLPQIEGAVSAELLRCLPR